MIGALLKRLLMPRNRASDMDTGDSTMTRTSNSDALRKLSAMQTGVSEVPLESQMESDYAQASGVPLSPMPRNTLRPRSSTQATQEEIDRIQTKDYAPGEYKDPITGDISNNPNKPGYTEILRPRGKDRDAQWSVKDKAGSASLGALEGLARGGPLGALLGGLGAGMDRNYMEKRADRDQMSMLRPRLAQQQQSQDFENDQAYKTAQTDYQTVRPLLEQQKVDIAADKEKRQTNYYEKILEDKKRGRDLQAVQIDDLKRYRDWLISNGDKNTEAKVKQIDERLRDYDLDRASREKIAGMGQAGQNRRQQITIAAQKEAAAVRAAETKGNRQEAQAGRERLLKLQQEYKALQP
jgi:hypothetical protein